MKPQRLAILGATGSIGGNTLDVVARHPGRYRVVALTGHSRVAEMTALCRQWQPEVAHMADTGAAQALAGALAGTPTRVVTGDSALVELAGGPGVDTVMAAIVGAAGLAPALAAARAGKRLLLANKEALVVGGALFMDAVRAGGAELLPIDSEHSAIFQCLPPERARWPEVIDRLILTASGGPFRTRDPATLAAVTPDEACAHPNWVMGRKISVDSATMMNKALEVIEARWLFGVAPRAIDVLIHPQSIVHSMVQCRDHSVLAQLGTPDMRVPIAYGLAWPERIASGAGVLDLLQARDGLRFFHPDPQRYPGLGRAWEALEARAGSTAVLNAANEVAVAAFLARRIRFDHIHAVVRDALDGCAVPDAAAASLEGLLALDAQARRHAETLVGRLAGAVA